MRGTMSISTAGPFARARGDVIEIFPASSEAKSVRIELFGDVVDAIHEIDPLTGKSLGKLPKIAIYPNTHYLIAPDRYGRAITGIERSWTRGWRR